jgi:hypothetical protein
MGGVAAGFRFEATRRSDNFQVSEIGFDFKFHEHEIPLHRWEVGRLRGVSFGGQIMSSIIRVGLLGQYRLNFFPKVLIVLNEQELKLVHIDNMSSGIHGP